MSFLRRLFEAQKKPTFARPSRIEGDGCALTLPTMLRDRELCHALWVIDCGQEPLAQLLLVLAEAGIEAIVCEMPDADDIDSFCAASARRYASAHCDHIVAAGSPTALIAAQCVAFLSAHGGTLPAEPARVYNDIPPLFAIPVGCAEAAYPFRDAVPCCGGMVTSEELLPHWVVFDPSLQSAKPHAPSEKDIARGGAAHGSCADTGRP